MVISNLPNDNGINHYLETGNQRKNSDKGALASEEWNIYFWSLLCFMSDDWEDHFRAWHYISAPWLRTKYVLYSITKMCGALQFFYNILNKFKKLFDRFLYRFWQSLGKSFIFRKRFNKFLNKFNDKYLNIFQDFWTIFKLFWFQGHYPATLCTAKSDMIFYVHYQLYASHVSFAGTI